MDFFTRFVNNLKRNFTDPVGLAQDMGKAEAEKNIPESERRFAVADYEIGTGKGSIKPGMYYTKPYEDTRTQAEKDKDERADARAKKAAEEAKKSMVTQAAEPVTTQASTATPVSTAQQTMTNLANTTTGAVTPTAATEEAKKDKKKGYKGDTIVTSPQGLLAGSGDALRPKRSLLAAA